MERIGHPAGGLTLSPRSTRLIGAVLIGLALPIAAISTSVAWQVVQAHELVIWYGIDLDIMRELGRRWLESGSIYLPYQLAGPYSLDVRDIATVPGMYPPVAGPLFGPLSALPWPLAAAFWWGVPLGILGYALARWRPAPWAWGLMLLMFAHPATPLSFMVGSTTMWMAALVGGGFLWHWPSALILVKPTLLPFALIGIRHRSWWIAAAVVVVLTFLGPWRDYITVVFNGSASAGGIGYSVSSVPLMLVPVFAYLGRRRAAEGDVATVGRTVGTSADSPAVPVTGRTTGP